MPAGGTQSDQMGAPSRVDCERPLGRTLGSHLPVGKGTGARSAVGWEHPVVPIGSIQSAQMGAPNPPGLQLPKRSDGSAQLRRD